MECRNQTGTPRPQERGLLSTNRGDLSHLDLVCFKTFETEQTSKAPAHHLKNTHIREETPSQNYTGSSSFRYELLVLSPGQSPPPVLKNLHSRLLLLPSCKFVLRRRTQNVVRMTKNIAVQTVIRMRYIPL